MIRRLLLSVLPVASLVGCDVGPDYHRPQLDTPGSFTSPGASSLAPVWPSTVWWEGFGSPELSDLIAQAEAHNLNLQSAIAAVSAADAAVRVAGGALLPTVSGGAGASWSQTNGTSFSTGTSSTGSTTATVGRGVIDTRTYSATLSASYEIDFWGKNLATFRAAEASAMSARYAAEVTALTVVSDVADTWFQALAYQDQLDVAQRNLAFAQTLLNVENGRLNAGTASMLDVSQQAALVAGQRANIPNLVSLEQQEVIALGILVGRPPEEIHIQAGTLTTIPSPVVIPGMPADLLRRRPDVAEAEATLVSATASTRAARAALFPSLTLTGSGGWENGAINGLFAPQSLVLNAAANAAQTLFDNGALSGQVAENRAIMREDRAAYEQAILQAYTDVETALTQTHYAAEQETLEQAAVAQAQLASKIARAQLEAGTVDITTLLTAQQTELTDENTLVSVRLARFQALVALFKALGGGWQQATPVTAQPVPILNPSIIP
ncbi:efflux transporter outer membrane subunit [Acidisoma cladoniae]|uniref:efflux transporter outer membrane subunit n=1 Tax=Acidisoma cladoniae TaxID=3040935 RepID=UPI00254E695D|nr:efflux transporter outer membrane subunit [Acidisoma sp. PAMC 29798]